MLAWGNLEKESLDQPGVADGMAEWVPCRICFTNKQIYAEICFKQRHLLV